MLKEIPLCLKPKGTLLDYKVKICKEFKKYYIFGICRFKWELQLTFFSKKKKKKKKKLPSVPILCIMHELRKRIKAPPRFELYSAWKLFVTCYLGRQGLVALFQCPLKDIALWVFIKTAESWWALLQYVPFEASKCTISETQFDSAYC